MEKLASGSPVGEASGGKQQDGAGSATQIADAAQRRTSARRIPPQLRRETRTRNRANAHECREVPLGLDPRDPVFMRALNGWLTIFWIVMIPVSIFTGWISSVTYVAALSLWALVSGHWSAWQAARVEVNRRRRRRSARRRTCQATSWNVSSRSWNAVGN